MNFQVGDTVIHWNYGLGQIIGQEERAVTGANQLYYVVKIQDLSIWVPADNQLASRIRRPTSPREFKKLFAILRSPAGRLSEDRRERKSELHVRMSGGNADAICEVIRDLNALELKKQLNDDDRAILKRARTLLLGEWEYSLAKPMAQAEADLHQLLSQPSPATGD